MAINYLDLIPSHFTDSVVLQDYIDVVGSLLDEDILSVAELKTLINPDNVPIEYIQKLADLVNLKIFGVGVWQDYQLRRQLKQAVDWYKIKGTYQSLTDIAYLFNLSLTIKDFYTNDYSTFIPEDWYVGDINTNPGGLSTAYYKSPHFGCYFNLDTAQGLYPDQYLWLSSAGDDFKTFLETVRPINTVPHYYLQLSPICNESKVAQTVSGNIQTTVTNNWTYVNVLFDDSKLFDNGELFDTSLSAFLSSLTKWKLGTGNRNTTPLATWTDLATPVLTYTSGVSYIQTDNYFQFDFEVPLATVQAGISELGLYTGAGALVLAATFPTIDKSSGYTLHITIKVNRGS